MRLLRFSSLPAVALRRPSLRRGRRMSMHSTGRSRDAEPLAVKPKGACQMLDCGLTRLYQLLNAGELVSYRDGGSRKITVASIREYQARRIAASQTEAA